MKNTNSLELIKKYGKSENDSGSPEVQIAILTDKIQKLSSHLKENKKDNHSYYGMMKMINLRKKMIKYLKGKSVERYKKIIESLNLRK